MSEEEVLTKDGQITALLAAGNQMRDFLDILAPLYEETQGTRYEVAVLWDDALAGAEQAAGEAEEQHEEKRIVYEEMKDGAWIPRKTFEVRSDPWIYSQAKYLSGNVNHRNVRAQKRTVTTITGPWEEVKP